MYDYAEDVVEVLRAGSPLALYGAGLVAFEAANCLMGKPYELKIEYCIVSEKGGNPCYITGIPVIDLESAKECLDRDTVIVIATMEKHGRPIQESLQKAGFGHVILLSFEGDLWNGIQGNYYRAYRLANGRHYAALEEELGKTLCMEREDGPLPSVYSVQCHVDKPLREDVSRFSWEIPIQAGAALTEQRICEVRDDSGDHISGKNRQYCELTALYWIWKNDRSDYVGLCHYRRHFELPVDMRRKLVGSDIDVVLTIPILNFPSVREVYRHDHDEGDWDVMLEAVRLIAPAYLATAIEVQNGIFYYGHNMLIARKEIFNDYCAWLFPILEYCEGHCGKRDDIYQDRYIGFLAERLMTVYFLYHEKQYKIVHARRHFVES
jgi:hypothetical protein